MVCREGFQFRRSSGLASDQASIVFCRDSDKFEMRGVNPMFDSRLGSFFLLLRSINDSFPLL